MKKNLKRGKLVLLGVFLIIIFVSCETGVEPPEEQNRDAQKIARILTLFNDNYRPLDSIFENNSDYTIVTDSNTVFSGHYEIREISGTSDNQYRVIYSITNTSKGYDLALDSWDINHFNLGITTEKTTLSNFEYFEPEDIEIKGDINVVYQSPSGVTVSSKSGDPLELEIDNEHYEVEFSYTLILENPSTINGTLKINDSDYSNQLNELLLQLYEVDYSDPSDD